MDRNVFIRLATVTLQGRGHQDAVESAEAIAQAMELFGKIMGDNPLGFSAMPMSPPAPAQTRPAFPAPAPDAIISVPEPVVSTQTIPMPAPEPGQQPPVQGLITTDLRMPAAEERAKARAADPEPVRSLRTPPVKLKVEDLNAMIQERTPKFITFDVPMDDGRTQRYRFERDTQSMHAMDCVKLIYYPPNTPPTAREATQVEMDISIDDLPVNLTEAVEKLRQDAVESIRPKGPPREVPVRPYSGPVKHRADESNVNADFAQQAEGLTNLTQAAFKSLG